MEDDDEDDDDQDERFEIEKILDYRKDGDGSFAFQVKWRDFPDSDISWCVPEATCCPAVCVRVLGIKARWKVGCYPEM